MIFMNYFPEVEPPQFGSCSHLDANNIRSRKMRAHERLRRVTFLAGPQSPSTFFREFRLLHSDNQQRRTAGVCREQ